MIPKTEIYFATRKTASAHVYITKGVGKVRINNVPVEMIPQETAREVILAPLEITGDLRDKIDISGLLTSSGLVAGGLLTGWDFEAARGAGEAAGRGTGFEAVGREGAAGGF